MRRAATLALTCLATTLAGCALTAIELQKTGELEEEFRSGRNVPAALTCIQRTAPQTDPRLLVQTQSEGAEGVALIYVGGHLWGVATAAPIGAGSRISVRVQPFLMGFERSLVVGAAKGC